jgi:hypothetical protein
VIATKASDRQIDTMQNRMKPEGGATLSSGWLSSQAA